MADEIDPLGADPVYQQLAAIIARRIRSGRLQPDRPIPSEAQMEQEFGVARGTARKAVEVLREQGLVRTVTGKGTFVLEPEPDDAQTD